MGGSSLLYISIAYYMQKGEERVQIACKIAYLLNGRPLSGKLRNGIDCSATIERSCDGHESIARLLSRYG